MSNDPLFRANELQTAIDGAGNVLLSFRKDTGETRRIVVRQTVIPQLITQLQARIARAQGAPNEVASPQPERIFALRGMQTHVGPNGVDQLILSVEPEPGRFISLPIALTPEDRQSLIESLNPQKDS
jgi:hypothetical protein